MPDVCTCGAQLPEDARFCHKCGKPQRDEPLLEEEPPPPPPPAAVEILPAPAIPAAPAPKPIGFSNGPAVRVGLVTGIMGFLITMLLGQLGVPFAVLWLLAVGGIAVALYRRATGQTLSMRSGAHLGWISGIFGFLLVTILLAIFAVMMSDASVSSAMRDQLKARGMPEAAVNQVIDLFRSPSGIFSALLSSFLLFTVLPAFGGALGAKFFSAGPNAGGEPRQPSA